MSDEIAIVLYSASGEYDDYRKTPIAVFTGRASKRRAERMAAACEAYKLTKPPEIDFDSDEWQAHYENHVQWRAAHPHDPVFEDDSTYSIGECLLNPKVQK